MLRLIWPSGFRGRDLKKLANQKQELPVAVMFEEASICMEGCVLSFLKA
jgi:hypothetical protein